MSYRVMAIDYGLKRIGIAMSDIMQILASPFSVINSINVVSDAENIVKLAVENNVGKIVVGIPYHMNGDESEMSGIVREFIKNIKKISRIPVIEIDERLTTSQAEKFLVNEGNISRSHRIGLKDKIAAAFILRIYLER